MSIPLHLQRELAHQEMSDHPHSNSTHQVVLEESSVPSGSTSNDPPQAQATDPSKRWPKLIAFDLDYTLWPLWVDTHVNPPLKRRGHDVNRVYDRDNRSMSFFKDVPSVLLRLRNEGVHIAACSRTSAPRAAKQALDQLLIPSSLPAQESTSASIPDPSDLETRSAIEMFDTLEIYPGSKLTHFRELHKKTGIPYAEMLFFDDEHRNGEVSSLGVTFILVDDSTGVDKATFERGLSVWRAKRQSLEDPDGETASQSKPKGGRRKG